MQFALGSMFCFVSHSLVSMAPKKSRNIKTKAKRVSGSSPQPIEHEPVGLKWIDPLQLINWLPKLIN